MGVGPCGWVSSFFSVPFEVLVGSLSISAPVCSLPIQFLRQQLLCEGLWGQSCDASAVFGIPDCSVSLSGALRSSGYPKSALGLMRDYQQEQENTWHCLGD